VKIDNGYMAWKSRRRNRRGACGEHYVQAINMTPSFRDGPKDQTSDAQLRIAPE
jgi:hypothetical protein